MDSNNKIQRKKNPRENANILSVLTFFYTRSIFYKGFKKDLEDNDLYEVLTRCRSKKCTDTLDNAYKGQMKFKKPEDNLSIFKVIWQVCGLKYTALGLLNTFGRLLLSIMEPVAISNLVMYFSPGQKKMTIYDAMHYGFLMIGVKVYQTIYIHNYSLLLNEMALQLRISFSSLIYRKALKLSPKALEQTSLGNIVTLITKDSHQFEHFMVSFHQLIVSLIDIVVNCYLVYARIGVSSVLGVTLLVAVIPLQTVLARFVKIYKTEMGKKTDNRLQSTQEALSAIKIIKMYTWEQIFGDKISENRLKEMKALRKTAHSQIGIVLASILGSNLAFYSIIMMYIHLNEDISADTLFYVVKVFGSLKVTISFSVSINFSKIGETLASFKRINHVLELEELPEQVEKPDDEPQINIRNASVVLQQREILKNINLKFEKGLNIVTGQLGCGKSSLIKAILGDYPVEEGGVVDLRGRKVYASQDPWLFPSTIRQNILFGEKYDVERYNQVVSACALEYDFNILENGDQTIVADRGMNLSKGQQARVNLARAIYRNVDIYLIDDALTALDTKVQEHIFVRCFQEILKDKCVILVTHNAKHIKAADNLVILEEGAVSFVGKQTDVSSELLEAFDDTENDKAEDIVEEIDKLEEADENSQLIKKDVPERSQRSVYHETKKTGSVAFGLYHTYYKMGGGFIPVVILTIFYLLFTFFTSYSTKSLTDWINDKETIISVKDQYSVNYNTDLEDIETENVTTIVLDNKLNVSAIIIKTLQKLDKRAANSLNIYTFMTFALAVTETLRFMLIWKFSISVSTNVYKKMIQRVLNATMAFFDTFFVGNILNRFAQDLAVIDETLTLTTSALFSSLFLIGGLFGLIVSAGLDFLVMAVISLLYSVILRIIYIKTARSLKRLEASTRSPIVGHLNSTMEGLTTVRAYKVQELLKNEFDTHQDLFVSATYTSITIKCTFAFLLDVAFTAFTAAVVIRFLFFDSGSAAGDVGLTLSNTSVLMYLMTMLLMGISDTENSMTSFERAMEFGDVEVETKSGVEVAGWPNKGEITYENVSLTYTNSREKILKGISFSAKPKMKIGIVGRTGAGKSSIISVLFRLYNYDGKILIDGIELKTLSLTFLRQHISIIPQDPIMFSGTVRSNVDPLEEFTDEEIWKALHKVHLDSKIAHLQTDVGDVNFSTGQRQLICLARAIIRKNKIVVLDEATANMDPEMEKLAEKIIEENFNSCTLLIIAHRLDSILSCDKVLVLNRGEIAEFDEPTVLLKNKNGIFSEMIKNAAKNDSIVVK